MNEQTADFERKCQRYVENNVYCNLSTIVRAVAPYREAGRATPTDLGQLAELSEEAAELCSPVLDYKEGARLEGFRECEHAHYGTAFYSEDSHWEIPASDPVCVDSWEALCRDMNIDPYEWEVFEHWAVSQSFGAALEEHGEKVLPFGDFLVWARTTTGQAVYADEVVEKIVGGEG